MKLFIFFFLMSCSQVPPKAQLSSYPDGANVAIKDQSGRIKSLGVTPLLAELPEEPVTLVFSKEGFDESQILVSLSDGEKADFLARLKSDAPSRDPETFSKVDRLGRDLVRAHNLMGTKKYSEAEALLSQLTREFPMVSVSYDLLGNLAYLERDSSRALKNYEKSLSINPENPETRRMVQRLKGNP